VLAALAIASTSRVVTSAARTSSSATRSHHVDRRRLAGDWRFVSIQAAFVRRMVERGERRCATEGSSP
jgi:hypothetical protein